MSSLSSGDYRASAERTCILSPIWLLPSRLNRLTPRAASKRRLSREAARWKMRPAPTGGWSPSSACALAHLLLHLSTHALRRSRIETSLRDRRVCSRSSGKERCNLRMKDSPPASDRLGRLEHERELAGRYRRRRKGNPSVVQHSSSSVDQIS